MRVVSGQMHTQCGEGDSFFKKKSDVNLKMHEKRNMTNYKVLRSRGTSQSESCSIFDEHSAKEVMKKILPRAIDTKLFHSPLYKTTIRLNFSS